MPNFRTIRIRGVFLVMCWMSLLSHAQPVTGLVVDAEDNQPLPSVNIIYNQRLKMGTQTDMNGRFTIKERALITEITFSFVGYEPQTFSRNEIPPPGKNWLVRLQPKEETLLEVEVLAGENPALRIIRNAIANKDKNNPNKLPSYAYRSYNKNVITYKLEADSTFTRKDSLKLEKDKEKSQSRHLLVIESVTEKKFMAPNRSTERVIGTRISGFENPNIGTVPTDIQHFGFYDDVLPLMDKKFLNPLADGAIKKYVYIIRDTLKRGRDSIYIIDYFPEKGANFEGFEGEMHISTDGWALEYVTAYPWDKGKINLSLEQYYFKPDGVHWFPRQLNFELELEKFPTKKHGAVMIGKTFLDSVVIEPKLTKDDFSLLEVKMEKKAGNVSDEFWEKHRKENLSNKEVTTYKKMDSIGSRYHFDELLRGTRHLYRGYIALGAWNVDMTKVLATNSYEGWRFGLGLYTNEDISEWFSVGGYFGYGTRDMDWKYGGHLDITLDQKNEVKVNFDYKRDVLNPGGIRINYWDRVSFATQFFNTLMDQVEERSLRLDFRAFTYSTFKIGFRQRFLQPTYDYTFVPQMEAEKPNFFQFTEVNFEWRMAYRERFMDNLGQRISLGSKYPVVHFIYSRGFENVLEGDFSYNKFEFGVQWDHYTPGLGRTLTNLEFGYVDQSIPYGMNFSMRPSYNPSFSVVVPNTFQTMRFNEFSSDKYVAWYFLHDFKTLLFRAGWFKPEVRIFQAIGFGDLAHPEDHVGIPNFKIMDKGYFESGLVFDNLIRINLANTGYFGIGLGGFYRYGAYHLPEFWDNWTLKLAFMYSVN